MTDMNSSRQNGLGEGNRAGRMALLVCVLALAATLFAAGRAFGATLYRYTDTNGVVHIVQRLDQVPPAYRDKATKVGGNVSVVTSPEGEPSNNLIDLLPLPESIKHFFSNEDYQPAPTASLPVIVITELVHTWLVVSAFFLLLFFLVLLLAQFLARDVVEKSRRLAYRFLLLGSFLAFTFFLCIGPGMRQTTRFLKDCRERTEAGLTLQGLNRAQREQLTRFHGLCSRWSERMEQTDE